MRLCLELLLLALPRARHKHMAAPPFWGYPQTKMLGAVDPKRAGFERKFWFAFSRLELVYTFAKTQDEYWLFDQDGGGKHVYMWTSLTGEWKEMELTATAMRALLHQRQLNRAPVVTAPILPPVSARFNNPPPLPTVPSNFWMQSDEFGNQIMTDQYGNELFMDHFGTKLRGAGRRQTPRRTRMQFAAAKQEWDDDDYTDWDFLR